MSGMKSWMLGTAVVAGALGMGVATAQTAEFGLYSRGPVAYVPPCPGPGYSWVPGYQNDGYWIPGRWQFRGGAEWGHIARFPHGEGREFDRQFNGGRDDRGRDRERFRR